MATANGHANVFGVYGNNGVVPADAYGNSRPFQTVPGGVTIYSGTDYYGQVPAISPT